MRLNARLRCVPDFQSRSKAGQAFLVRDKCRHAMGRCNTRLTHLANVGTHRKPICSSEHVLKHPGAVVKRQVVASRRVFGQRPVPSLGQ